MREMDRNYKTPPIVWLKVTDYMHGWLEWELGCAARIRDQRVVCLQDITGARDVLRMETVEDVMDRRPVASAMSATRRNCIMAGMVRMHRRLPSMSGRWMYVSRRSRPAPCSG